MLAGMSETTIRPAYSMWPQYNRRLRDVVAAMTEDQLAIRCPGDDDLDHPLNGAELAEALDSSFRIIENCLDRWTVDMLADELRRDMGREEWVHIRGSVIQRLFSHDVYHCGELSQTLGIAGLPQIDLWD
jgi:hypothetical protein